MFRCKICKLLQADADAVLDKNDGYQCINGCEEPFIQPPYEGPLNDNFNE